SVRIIQLCLCLSFESGIRMLDGDDGGHAVTNVGACKICIFLFQDSEFSRILIHYSGKCSLKAGQMCTALCIIYIIAEAQHIFMKFVYILKRRLNFDPVRLTLKVYRIMKDLFLF